MSEAFTPEHIPASIDRAPTALEIAERAQIDGAIATAKRYPRQIGTVKQAMLSFATLDEETASGCFYSLPRGGKTIQGPSVRLAEIALSCYGNARAQTRVLEVVTGEAPHVVVESVCMDLERNVAVSIQKRARIFTKKGKPAPDEDDINLACNRCSAIAFRDAVFKVVPGALVKPVCDAARKVAIGDAKTLATRRAGAVKELEKMGAIRSRILAAVDAKTIDDIDMEGLGTLIGLFTSIRDGNTTVDEAFPKPESEEKKDKAVLSLGNAPNAKPVDDEAAKALDAARIAAQEAKEAAKE